MEKINKLHLKYVAISVFCTAAILLLSGCGKVKEINDTAIVSGMTADIASGGAWQISAEVVNKFSSSDPKEAREIIWAEGSTLADALESCNFQDSRQIYFSHAKTLAVSRRLAESGIGPVLDYVMRNYKMRLSMNLLVWDPPGSQPASSLSSPSTGLAYLDLDEMIQTDSVYGACAPMRIYQAVNTLSQGGTQLAVPILSAAGDQSENRAVLAGTAVFRGDRMVGRLSRDETLYLLLLQDHLQGAHLSLPEYQASFRIDKARTSFRPGADGSSLAVDVKLECALIQAPGPQAAPEAPETAGAADESGGAGSVKIAEAAGSSLNIAEAAGSSVNIAEAAGSSVNIAEAAGSSVNIAEAAGGAGGAESAGIAGGAQSPARDAYGSFSRRALSRELGRKVEESCCALIRKAQAMDADIFAFGKAMKGRPYRFHSLPVTVRCGVYLKLGEVH